MLAQENGRDDIIQLFRNWNTVEDERTWSMFSLSNIAS